MPDDLTNFDQHTAWFREYVDSFNFKLPGIDGSLGKDMANKAAQLMTDRSEQQQMDAEGQQWKPNETRYAAYKAKKYNVHSVGVFTGQMLSQESMLGQLEIEESEVTMKYGTNLAATKFRGGETYDEKDPPTDRQKAQWFEEGGRKFYAIDEHIASELMKVAEEAVDKHLEEINNYKVL